MRDLFLVTHNKNNEKVSDIYSGRTLIFGTSFNLIKFLNLIENNYTNDDRLSAIKHDEYLLAINLFAWVD